MNKRVKDAFDEFAAVLHDTTIPRGQYVDALEEIIAQLEGDLAAAREDAERELLNNNEE